MCLVEGPLVWVYLMFFPWLGSGGGFGNEGHRGKVSFSLSCRGTHDSATYRDDLDLDPLPVCFCKGTSAPVPTATLWKQVTQ